MSNGADVEDKNCRPPWIVPTNNNKLKEYIELYLNHEDMRAFIMGYSAGWMRRWWNEKLIVDRLVKIYEK